MNEFPFVIDRVVIFLLTIVALSSVGLIITLILYFLKRSGFMKRQKRFTRSAPQMISRSYPKASSAGSGGISDYKINEILSSGRFSAAERKAEYRRRGKSPSGVIDGVYNDAYQENGKPYSDVDRDWDADA